MQARDLGLGSGGFDIVHVNLTRGLTGDGRAGRERDEAQLHEPSAHARAGRGSSGCSLPRRAPGRACSRCTASSPRWPGPSRRRRPRAALGTCRPRAARCRAGTRAQFARCASAACWPGTSRPGAAFGGEGEAITTAAALHHGLRTLGWDAAVCGPGPGIVGSGSPLGHGGMSALDSAHVALALGCPGAARRAHVLGRSARAPSRNLPPHAHGARPAARAGHGRAARGDALARRAAICARASGRSSRRARCRAPARRCGSTSSARRASPATTGAAPPSTCRPIAASGLPAQTMGRGLTRTRCSSARRWRAARRSASLPRGRSGERLAPRPDGGIALQKEPRAARRSLRGESDRQRSDEGPWPPASVEFHGDRASDPRLPRLPRARAGLSRTRSRPTAPTCCSSAQFLARRGLSVQEAQHGDLAAFLPSWPTDRSARRPRRRSAQGRLPALVLPPPAPRGHSSSTTPPPSCAVRAGHSACRGCSRARRSRGCSSEPKGTEPRALRDRALLEVMYACGLRASEATGLQLAGRRPRGGDAARARQGLQGAPRADRPPGDRRAARLQRSAGVPAAGRRTRVAGRSLFVNRRGGGAHAPGPLQDRPGPRRAAPGSTRR